MFIQPLIPPLRSPRAKYKYNYNNISHLRFVYISRSMLRRIIVSLLFLFLFLVFVSLYKATAFISRDSEASGAQLPCYYESCNSIMDLGSHL